MVCMTGANHSVWYEQSQSQSQSRIWSDSPLRNDRVYKFVKVNGQYRFFPVEIKHSQAVEPGETAEAAGLVIEGNNGWKFESTYSTTLQIGSGQTELEELEQIIGKPYNDW